MVSKIARVLGVLVLSAVPMVARAAEPAAAGGVKGEIVAWIQDAEDKLTELANATPEGKYAWRPAKGARTVGDVFMHVAGANFGIPSMVGVKAPEGFNFQTYEKSLTKKADIDKAMKDSFAHVKKALLATSDADLEKPVDLFGRKTTVRGAYLMALSHVHEHLGQSIAYARSNNIEPPWTARYSKKSDKGGAAKTAE
ncbi:MAG TPA: DinB family protein [Polyangia bacterium]